MPGPARPGLHGRCTVPGCCSRLSVSLGLRFTSTKFWWVEINIFNAINLESNTRSLACHSTVSQVLVTECKTMAQQAACSSLERALKCCHCGPEPQVSSFSSFQGRGSWLQAFCSWHQLGRVQPERVQSEVTKHHVAVPFSAIIYGVDCPSSNLWGSSQAMLSPPKGVPDMCGPQIRPDINQVVRTTRYRADSVLKTTATTAITVTIATIATNWRRQ